MINSFISLNIRYLVDKEKISKDAFGKLFGLNRGAISSYIDGKSKPKIETLEKISEKYQVTIDDLVKKDLNKHDGLAPFKIAYEQNQNKVTSILRYLLDNNNELMKDEDFRQYIKMNSKQLDIDELKIENDENLAKFRKDALEKYKKNN